MEMPIVKSGLIKSLVLAISSIIFLTVSSSASTPEFDYPTRESEKKIKIPRLTDTDYVIFLIGSAKANIQLSYKVNVTTKVV